MNNKRIVMLGHKAIPTRSGGIEVVVEEIATRMAKLGYDVTCLNRKTTDKYINDYQGVKIKQVFTINKRGLAAVSSSIFGSIVAAFGKYDVVHYHAEGTALICWLPKLFGKRVIVTIHGLDHTSPKWGKFASWYIELGEKSAVKYADNIIVLSKSDEKYFLDSYNRKTVLIPNGVNKPQIINADLICQKYGLNKDDYILFLGRIVPGKGVDYLIQAYNQIDTDKKLVIAGGSSDTDEYCKQIKQLAINNKKIIFTDFVSGKLLEELYSNAYLYCLPSDLEGMPLSLMEAMSYGNCCLTSDIKNCTDVIENNGYIFKKGNIEDLKQKLEQLCNNKGLVYKYKEKTREFICNKYNWDDVVNRTLEIYNN